MLNPIYFRVLKGRGPSSRLSTGHQGACVAGFLVEEHSHISQGAFNTVAPRTAVDQSFQDLDRLRVMIVLDVPKQQDLGVPANATLLDLQERAFQLDLLHRSMQALALIEELIGFVIRTCLSRYPRGQELRGRTPEPNL